MLFENFNDSDRRLAKPGNQGRKLNSDSELNDSNSEMQLYKLEVRNELGNPFF